MKSCPRLGVRMRRSGWVRRDTGDNWMDGINWTDVR